MSNVENLVNEQNKQIAKLTEMVKELEEHIKDFETLALQWKKSYVEMEHSYKVRLANAEQIIEELMSELNE